MTERERFEKWYSLQPTIVYGDLSTKIMQAQWEAWQSARRWIPVEEELPKSSQYIIFQAWDKEVYLGVYCSEDNLFEAKDIKTFAIRWQPLPTLPEEDWNG